MRLGFAFFTVFAVCPILANADVLAPVALNSLSAAPHAVIGAKLMDQRGHMLGQVARVQTDQDGRPSALAFVPTGSRKLVVIGAAAVSYDGNTLVAGNDQPQIAALSGTRVAAE